MQNKDYQKLRECPFCGGEAKFVHIFENPEKCMVSCRECDGGIDAVFANEEAAAEAWNRRAQASNDPLTLDELRKMDGSPVWWWNKSHAPVCTICIVRFGEVSFADFDYSHEDSTGIVQYKRWIKWGFKPYHRKPEGSTKK